MSKIKKKLSSRKGETILETLVALLIIVLAISFLSASIAKSAKISNEIKKTVEDGFVYEGESVGKLNVSDDQGLIKNRQVTVYSVENESGTYYYFKPQAEG